MRGNSSLLLIDDGYGGGKGVPVILTEDVKDALSYLSNREIREKAGLSSSKYLFANSIKRKTPNHARQKWTAEEETELKELFKENFSEKRCPRQKEIENNIKKSRSRGGVIYKRPIKKK